MVPMWSKDDYKQKLTRNLKLSELDKLLRNCYNEAKSAGFAFELDKFGRYGFFYRGRQQLKIGSTSDTKHLPGITGFLEKIPDNVVESLKDISLFRKIELCKTDRIMIGSSPFANHIVNIPLLVLEQGKLLN